MFNPSEQTIISIITYRITSIWYISAFILMAHELNKRGCPRCHYYARPSLHSSIVGRLTPFLPCKGRVTAFNTNEPEHIFHKHLVTSDIP